MTIKRILSGYFYGKAMWHGRNMMLVQPPFKSNLKTQEHWGIQASLFVQSTVGRLFPEWWSCSTTTRVSHMRISRGLHKQTTGHVSKHSSLCLITMQLTTNLFRVIQQGRILGTNGKYFISSSLVAQKLEDHVHFLFNMVNHWTNKLETYLCIVAQHRFAIPVNLQFVC